MRGIMRKCIKVGLDRMRRIKRFLKTPLYFIFNLFSIDLCFQLIKSIVYKQRGNSIKIGRDTRIRNIKISFCGCNNSIYIGDDCNLNGIRLLLKGNNNKIVIGNSVFINGTKIQPVTINACEGKTISIGDDCIFSNNIEIHTTDYHTIFDKNANRTNHASDIIIGEHCWIGLRVVILKGSSIPNNTIVGAGAIVSGRHEIPYCLLTGIPAKSIKQDVYWDIRLH